VGVVDVVGEARDADGGDGGGGSSSDDDEEAAGGGDGGGRTRLRGWAHEGMLQAARTLVAEVLTPLMMLAAEGYRIVMSGHSLGGGVASILTILLRPFIPSVTCIGFATPSVIAGRRLRRHANKFIFSVIHRHDAVPRFTIRSIRSCLRELAEFDTWRQDIRQDVKSILNRAADLFAPPTRPTHAVTQLPLLSQPPLLALPAPAPPSTAASPPTMRAPSPPLSPSPLRPALAAGGSSSSSGVVVRLEARGTARVQLSIEPLQQRVVVPLATTLSAASPAAGHDGRAATATATPAASAATESPAGASSRGAEVEADPSAIAAADGSTTPPRRTDIGDAPVLRIPGSTLHLYTLHGVYHAAWLPHHGRGPDLRRIQLTPHMLSDHKSEGYLLALKTLRAAASAPEPPPRWVPYSEAGELCACCKSPFTWEMSGLAPPPAPPASSPPVATAAIESEGGTTTENGGAAATAEAEGQCEGAAAREASDEMRSAAAQVCARHHCRACGNVVCNACSLTRQSLPQFGILSAVRICDSCFFKV
jgi:hypothetical protein